MKIRFWQNIVSPHQSEVLNALASQKGAFVSLIVQDDFSAERKRLGWKEPVLHNVQIVRDWSASDVNALLNDRHDIEIFTAPWGYRKIRAAFRAAVERPEIRIAVMSEPGDWRGIKGFARVLRGRIHAALYQKRVAFVLAIGDLAEEWFRKCRFPTNKIFPYAYTTAKLSTEISMPEGPHRKLAFVGQLVHRKGVDRLLFALAELRSMDWEMAVVGDGAGRPYFQLLSRILGIGDRVRFLGVLAQTKVIEQIGKSDLLILPSRWDGWGAVVNEALQCGVPVLCSDTCGAKRLIRNGRDGQVFRHDGRPSLIERLRELLTMPAYDAEARESIAERAGAVSGSAVAKYLEQIIRWSSGASHERPVAPWDAE